MRGWPAPIGRRFATASTWDPGPMRSDRCGRVCFSMATAQPSGHPGRVDRRDRVPLQVRPNPARRSWSRLAAGQPGVVEGIPMTSGWL